MALPSDGKQVLERDGGQMISINCFVSSLITYWERVRVCACVFRSAAANRPHLLVRNFFLAWASVQEKNNKKLTHNTQPTHNTQTSLPCLLR